MLVVVAPVHEDYQYCKILFCRMALSFHLSSLRKALSQSENKYMLKISENIFFEIFNITTSPRQISQLSVPGQRSYYFKNHP